MLLIVMEYYWLIIDDYWIWKYSIYVDKWKIKMIKDINIFEVLEFLRK